MSLYSNLANTSGLAEDNSTLVKSIVAINENEKEQLGDVAYLKPPSASTVKFYQFLSVKQDNNIHLVKQSTTKMKGKRRQMASMSCRNCDLPDMSIDMGRGGFPASKPIRALSSVNMELVFVSPCLPPAPC